MAGSLTGSSAKRQAAATAKLQQDEIDKQREIAQQSQVSAMQDTLDADTNRLLRTYQTRAIMAGGRSLR